MHSWVVLFLRTISIYWVGLGAALAVLNYQVVPIAQVVLRQVSWFLFAISLLTQTQLIVALSGRNSAAYQTHNCQFSNARGHNYLLEDK